jgi:hypothetical protein
MRAEVRDRVDYAADVEDAQLAVRDADDAVAAGRQLGERPDRMLARLAAHALTSAQGPESAAADSRPREDP